MLLPATLHDVHFFLKGEIGLEQMPLLKLLSPFHIKVTNFLADVSETLRKDKLANQYPDIATLAFFCRKANLKILEKPYLDIKKNSLGRGVSFHIAPSNIPINFAYSLVAGLLSGNACIIRVSEKKFPQVEIVCNVIRNVLTKDSYADLRNYIVIMSYGHSLDLNTYFSSLCDVRIIWGGDNSISEIRKASLPAHAFDITFSDRYSVSAINAENYLSMDNKDKIAISFYNDTYLFDQNACSSPKLIVWLGNENTVTKAKIEFWENEYQLLKNKGYKNEAITVIDKFSTVCRAAIGLNNAKLEMDRDHTIMRIKIDTLEMDLPKYACSGGIFYEYTDTNLENLIKIITRKYQTLTYIGFEADDLSNMIVKNGAPGIDRIVPVGYATSFSLVWDGYDLIRQMSKMVGVQ
jgi:hypothetical protein